MPTECVQKLLTPHEDGMQVTPNCWELIEWQMPFWTMVGTVSRVGGRGGGKMWKSSDVVVCHWMSDVVVCHWMSDVVVCHWMLRNHWHTPGHNLMACRQLPATPSPPAFAPVPAAGPAGCWRCRSLWFVCMQMYNGFRQLPAASFSTWKVVGCGEFQDMPCHAFMRTFTEWNAVDLLGAVCCMGM